MAADPSCQPLPLQYTLCRDWIIDTSGTSATQPCPDLDCCSSPAGQSKTADCQARGQVCFDAGPNWPPEGDGSMWSYLCINGPNPPAPPPSNGALPASVPT